VVPGTGEHVTTPVLGCWAQFAGRLVPAGQTACPRELKKQLDGSVVPAQTMPLVPSEHPVPVAPLPEQSSWPVNGFTTQPDVLWL
jgi:hypothetical protein